MKAFSLTFVFSSRIPITPTATTVRTSTTNAVRGTATGAGGATARAARSASARPPVPRRGARTPSSRAVLAGLVPAAAVAATDLPAPPASAVRGRGRSGADRAPVGPVAPAAEGRPGPRRADAPASRRACRMRRVTASLSWTYMLNPLIRAQPGDDQVAALTRPPGPGVGTAVRAGVATALRAVRPGAGTAAATALRPVHPGARAATATPARTAGAEGARTGVAGPARGRGAEALGRAQPGGGGPRVGRHLVVRRPHRTPRQQP